jgi:hypothetical protein
LYNSIAEKKEEITFLGSLPLDSSAMIWRRLMVNANEEGPLRLIQLLYTLRYVCKAWRSWIEDQDEWEASRRFGEFNLDEFDDYSYPCDSDGLPYDMYPEGYFDEEF